MTSTSERALTLRMLISIALLVLTAGGFVVAIWGVFVAVGLLFRLSRSTATTLAIAPTAAVLLAVAFLEYRGSTTFERAAAARPVDADEYPGVHAAVTRVASMYGLPTPTVAISERRAPEAMVVGVRPSTTRLVLSTGTLEALEEDELEAVIAHELAHVRNRDARVMTVVSAPTVIATGLVLRSPNLAKRDLTIAIALAIVGLLGVVLTRASVAVLSRTRELAADRAAAEITGSAAPLASALRTLDRRIRETPSEDLRKVRPVSVLSILPFASHEGIEATTATRSSESTVEPFPWSVRKPLARRRRALFRTHPPTEKRLSLLAEYERENT
ncbi:M48 family metalloprotease [Natrarchaeobius oligotrophus]|uniref:Peptidase M48 n=1 Tax=Natrarchaeobius chitinivorans TaxID=1679083 RepID=A0A3N6MJZ7_NATCH|nr:M48 family metalloprotease [Natrarchaeobius chitinivorans]RQG96211.1 peptidase M48 [Natrarchaeobius chitinivorans]